MCWLGITALPLCSTLCPVFLRAYVLISHKVPCSSTSFTSCNCNRQIDTKGVYREKDNTLGCSVRVSHIFIGAIFRNITPCLLILFIPWHINKLQPLNSFLQELCKSPFIQSEICTSPHWHCSANAGKRTPPLPLCKHHELRAATEAALSLSLSLPLFLSVPLSLTCVLSCSLLKHLSSHFCLTIISSSPS